jgi:hypothetical protein
MLCSSGRDRVIAAFFVSEKEVFAAKPLWHRL